MESRRKIRKKKERERCNFTNVCITYDTVALNKKRK